MLNEAQEWHHKFSAFRVVVDVRDKDIVFKDFIWPVGSDDRDWWFTSKQT